MTAEARRRTSINWHGDDWTPDADHPAAHPNSRFTTPAAQDPGESRPSGRTPPACPIDAILLGGRRATTIPLVHEAFDWEHGVLPGATMSSETTAAAAGQVGKLRFRPLRDAALLRLQHGPDYFEHWLEIGRRADADKLPRIFYVNWFRKDADGRFLWPGFGENSRVLEWVFRRCAGDAGAHETPIGLVPGGRRPLHRPASTSPPRTSPPCSRSTPRRCARSSRRSASTWRCSVTGLPAEVHAQLEGARAAPRRDVAGPGRNQTIGPKPPAQAGPLIVRDGVGVLAAQRVYARADEDEQRHEQRGPRGGAVEHEQTEDGEDRERPRIQPMRGEASTAPGDVTPAGDGVPRLLNTCEFRER